MNGIRKFLSFAMAALALAAFAVPTSAATKSYSLDITSTGTPTIWTVSSTAIPQGGGAAVNVPVGGGTVYATIVNQTPGGGNSAINSFTFFKPPNWTISSPVGPSGTVFDLSTGNLKVSNIPSLLPKDQQGAHGITIAFTLKPDACNTAAVTWVTTSSPPNQYLTVYTGNFSATTFTFVKDSTSGTTGTNQVTGVSTCTFTVTPSVGTAGGSISPSTAQTVNYNTTMSFTVAPNAGYHIDTVGGTCGGSLNGNAYTTNAVTANCTVVANFAINTFKVTPSVGAGSGTITPSTQQTVNYNTTTSFTLGAGTGYHVDTVGGTCGGSLSGNVYTTNAVIADCTVIANFAINTYTVTPSAGANGSISPSTPQVVNYNATPSFTVTPNSGYYISSTGGTCGGSLVGNTYTTNAVTANCSVTASFAAKALTIGSAPSSGVVGTEFFVTVGINPAGGTVTESDDCSATVRVTASSSTSITYGITVGTMPTSGACNFTFSDSADGYTSASLSNFKIYKGTLNCNDYDSINTSADKSYDPDLSSSLAGLGSSYVGAPGWGIRRGPNKDGAACVPVNYSCNMDLTQDPAIVTCTWDKNVVPAQQATFKYLFLWPAKAPDASGYSSYRPQVSWPPAVPDTTTAKAYKFPTWAPLVACISDTFPTLPTLPTTILPQIPSAAPFSTDPDNTLAQYQPTATAWVCGGQSGWTAVGAPSGPSLIQQWNIVIDEADLTVRGP